MNGRAKTGRRNPGLSNAKSPDFATDATGKPRWIDAPAGASLNSRKPAFKKTGQDDRARGRGCGDWNGVVPTLRLVEPTEMERRLNLPPEAFERELAAWLKERPLLNDAGPGNRVIQWLRETWVGGDYQDGPPQRWLPESLVRGLVASGDAISVANNAGGRLLVDGIGQTAGTAPDCGCLAAPCPHQRRVRRVDRPDFSGSAARPTE